MNVCFTLRVDFNNKDKARELKCYWCPDDKKWKKSFCKKYYPRIDNHEFLRVINRFKETCYENDFIIEDDDGLEELQDWVDEDLEKIEKCIAKPSPIDAYRGRGSTCLIVDE